jgi:hypothetical protein
VSIPLTKSGKKMDFKEFKTLNKKSAIYLAVFIAAIVIIAVAALYYYYWYRPKVERPTPSAQPTQEELLIKKQLQELDQLRQKAGVQTSTEEQINQQREQLDVLRNKANNEAPPKETIQQQADDLNKLRELAK